MADKRFLRALKGEVLSPPPFWLMRQAGRYLPEYRDIRSTAKNFLDFCYTPDKAVEVTLQPLRRYDMDAAILFSDILVIPDALGQQVEFKAGEGPKLKPIRDLAGIEQLNTDNIKSHLAPVFEIVKRLANEIPKHTALIGFAGAPWTVATYVVEGQGSKDYATVRELAWREPKTFAKLIEVLVDATSEYLIEQINAGAEAVQLFDSWAGVLAESQFMRWVVEPTHEIVRRVHAVHKDVPFIGFPRGAGVLYETFVKQTGVNGVSLDSTVPLTWARDHLQPHVTVQGNLDNLALVAGGEALENEVHRILDTLGKGPFIFNLGHGIVPHTPPEHVERLAALIRQHGTE